MTVAKQEGDVAGAGVILNIGAQRFDDRFAATREQGSIGVTKSGFGGVNCGLRECGEACLRDEIS